MHEALSITLKCAQSLSNGPDEAVETLTYLHFCQGPWSSAPISHVWGTALVELNPHHSQLAARERQMAVRPWGV
jgi:hypothetical protein